jgi:NAD(P)-dependent dehydrogenase (short-subunit alcohol dehydrogenase family)
VVDEIVSAGGNAVADTNTVATEQGAAALIQTAVDAYGGVDILVNNAGISMSADFDEITSRDFERTINVNLMGTIWTCRAAWSHMRRAGYGRIVNTSSGALAGLGRLSAYAASKGGVFSFTRALAVDGEPLGIKANTVNPAAYTRMLESQQAPESSLLIMAKESQPAELVSPAVASLAHESCPVNGECISAVGGYVNRLSLVETAGFADPELTIERLVERWDEVVDESEERHVPAGFIDVNQWTPKPYEP